MIEAFHGTVHEFDEFAPFTHFGTAKAATARMDWLTWSRPGTSPRLLHVTLDISNPLVIKDANGMLHGICALLDMLHYRLRVLTSEERDRCFVAGRGTDGVLMRMALVGILEEKGYDGFVYTNRVEDPGSQSWVIFRSDQVKAVAAVDLAA